VVEAIADTGPILHLHEIGLIGTLTSVFESLLIPHLVAEELHKFGIDLQHLETIGLSITVATVEKQEWDQVLSGINQPAIQPADAQVFVIAKSTQFQKPILTDDLTLRRRLESQQATVIGTVGVLVRAYTKGRLKRNELENAIDALFTTSSLHLSIAFRSYIRQLITNLP
jgi:predicted nucleic acid-binding protein